MRDVFFHYSVKPCAFASSLSFLCKDLIIERIRLFYRELALITRHKKNRPEHILNKAIDVLKSVVHLPGH